MKPDVDVDLDDALVLDGTDAVLGRLASTVASAALDGRPVVVTNAERIVVSGDPDEVAEDYRARDEEGSDRGPKYPKRPDGIAKRSVRGMLPMDKQRGRDAMRRIRFYVGEPEDLGDADAEEPDAVADDIGRGRHVSIGEVSERIGANVTW